MSLGLLSLVAGQAGWLAGRFSATETNNGRMSERTNKLVMMSWTGARLGWTTNNTLALL